MFDGLIKYQEEVHQQNMTMLRVCLEALKAVETQRENFTKIQQASLGIKKELDRFKEYLNSPARHVIGRPSIVRPDGSIMHSIGGTHI